MLRTRTVDAGSVVASTTAARLNRERSIGVGAGNAAALATFLQRCRQGAAGARQQPACAAGVQRQRSGFCGTQVRPRNGVQIYDTDAIAWRDAVVAAGSSAPDSTLLPVHHFIRGLKSDGLWDLIYDMGMFVGAGSLVGALVKLKTPTGVSRNLTNTNFVSGDYVASGVSAGLTANGVKSLNTNVPTTVVGTGASSVGVYTSTGASAANTGFLIGGSNSGPSNGWGLQAQNNPRIFIAMGSSTSDVINGASVGFILCSYNVAAFLNGVNVGAHGTPNAIFSGTIPLFTRGGNGGTNYTGTIRFYFMGQGMTALQAVAMSSRVNALMTAFGANTY